MNSFLHIQIKKLDLERATPIGLDLQINSLFSTAVDSIYH